MGGSCEGFFEWLGWFWVCWGWDYVGGFLRGLVGFGGGWSWLLQGQLFRWRGDDGVRWLYDGGGER